MSNYISAERLGHQYHDKWMFRDINFGINAGQRIALVGVNGAGKSTMMNIIAKILEPSEGKLIQNKSIRIGHLEQDPLPAVSISISDYLFSDEHPALSLIKQYEILLENPEGKDNEINELTDALSAADAWEYEHKIKHILGILGIHQLNQNIATLSGGQKKRIALAKLLIEDPDLYILDEPTNHLDIDTIEWLEDYLNKGNKTLMMVTHDRYFLDNVCNEIMEIDRGSVFSYKGNYSYYLEKKAEREEMDKASYEKNKNLWRKELEWMRRQPKARTTKSKSRIDAFGKLDEKTKELRPNQEVELSVKMSTQGNKILELHHIGKSYGDKNIINDFSYVFKKKDRIGVAGKNGSGKSTFLQLITQQIQPDKGKIIVGETTVYGYYRQDGLKFDEDMKVIDVVKDVADYIIMSDGKQLSASQLLTKFLFPPAKQNDKVSKLSGGEKKRLQLMRILMLNPNFLILDEPTNDLDIDTLNILEDFLITFPGCLVLVSHDRYLVDSLTDHLFIFEGNGEVQTYNGNYTDYRVEKEEELELQKQLAKQQKVAEAQKVQAAAASKKKLSFKEQKELETLEQEISSLENRKVEITSEIANTTEVEKIISLSNELEVVEKNLGEKELRWLELSEK
jgi:ATP-binding cassette subfamily F protein uup